jgi:subtilisin-like proprotein convertase family protein
MKIRLILVISIILTFCQIALAGSFEPNNDGTITDVTTGLMWQQQDDGQARTWEQALAYCENLRLPDIVGGYTDWKLPNIKELESITSDEVYGPAIDPIFTGAKSSDFWSSTTFAGSPGSAWYVYFGDGSVYCSAESYASYVRCVRSGQSGALDNLALSVTKSGTGSGDVMAVPGYLSWSGNDGTNEYPQGTIVILRPVASDGSVFAGWTGCDMVNGTECRVKMDNAKNVTATFNLASDKAMYWENVISWSGDGFGNSIKQTTDGGYIVAAQPSAQIGADDAMIIKLNKDGTIQWQKTFGTSGAQAFWDILQTSDGGFVAGGWTSSGVWVMKLNQAGTILWQKTYSGGIVNHIIQTIDGGFVVAGYGSGLLKLHPDGTIQWQKTYGEGGSTSVGQTSDGGYVFTVDDTITKIDASGAIIWRKSFADDSTSSYIYDIAETADGGFIAVGHVYPGPAGRTDIWAVKLTSNGSVEWQKTYGGSSDDDAYSVLQTADGGYILAGPTGTGAALILGLNADGSVLWQKAYGNDGYTPSSISLSSDGGLLVAGWTGGSVSNIWLMKTDKDGSIPNCSSGGNVSVIVADSALIASDSTSAITDTNAVVQTPQITGITSNASMIGICFAGGPSKELDVYANGPGIGSVSAYPGSLTWDGTKWSDFYDYGTAVTLTASVAPGSTFDGWTGCTVSTTNPLQCTVTMDKARSVIAAFSLNTYELTVIKSGQGNGDVVADPGTLNWDGNTGTNSYNYGTSVTLTAKPNVGSSFTGWSGGDCSGTGSCTVTMDAVKSVTAMFGSATDNVSTDVPKPIPDNDPAGAVSTLNVSGSNCGSLADVNVTLQITHPFVGDLAIVLTNVPTGRSALLFAGSCGGDDNLNAVFDDQAATDVQCPPSGTFKPANPLSVFNGINPDGAWTLQVMDLASGDVGTLDWWGLDLTCGTAALNILKTGPGSSMGNVEANPGPLTWYGSEGQSVYDWGTAVNITATPSDNCTFLSFSGACNGNASPCSVVMSGNQTVNVDFYTHTVWIEGTNYYGTSIQTAYDDAISGDVIRSRAPSESENLLFDKDKQVTLQGGFSGCSYSDNTGNFTTINGSLTIGGQGSGSGSVTIENLVIK